MPRKVTLSIEATVALRREAIATFDQRADLTMSLQTWKRLWLEQAEEWIEQDLPKRNFWYWAEDVDEFKKLTARIEE